MQQQSDTRRRALGMNKRRVVRGTKMICFNSLTSISVSLSTFIVESSGNRTLNANESPLILVFISAIGTLAKPLLTPVENDTIQPVMSNSHKLPNRGPRQAQASLMRHSSMEGFQKTSKNKNKNKNNKT